MKTRFTLSWRSFLLISSLFLAVSLFSDTMKLSTYYASPYGQYTTLKTNNQTRLSTAGGEGVVIGSAVAVSPAPVLDVRGTVNSDSNVSTSKGDLIADLAAGPGVSITGTGNSRTISFTAASAKAILSVKNIADNMSNAGLVTGPGINCGSSWCSLSSPWTCGDDCSEPVDKNQWVRLDASKEVTWSSNMALNCPNGNRGAYCLVYVTGDATVTADFGPPLLCSDYSAKSNPIEGDWWARIDCTSDKPYVRSGSCVFDRTEGFPIYHTVYNSFGNFYYCYAFYQTNNPGGMTYFDGGVQHFSCSYSQKGPNQPLSMCSPPQTLGVRASATCCNRQ